jgi:hypothetical protein
MRLAVALVLSAGALCAQPYGGFAGARVRTLAADEYPAPPAPKASLPLTLVILKGTNWSENRVLRHVRRTAAAFAACGVALGPVTLVEAKTPDGRRDLEMTAMRPDAGTPQDVYRIARLMPPEAQWPVAFFVGRLLGDRAAARSYGRGEVEPGWERDYPYMNTAWFAYKTHWIERRDEGYSSLAHELMHLLCECGHVEDDAPHLMNTHRNMLSSQILPEHCERILTSPLLTPARPSEPGITH